MLHEEGVTSDNISRDGFGWLFRSGRRVFATHEGFLVCDGLSILVGSLRCQTNATIHDVTAMEQHGYLMMRCSLSDGGRGRTA